MSPSTYVPIPVPTKIRTPRSAGMLATEGMPATAGMPTTAGTKETVGTPTTPGMPAIAGRPATVRTLGTKGASEQQECQQQHAFKEQYRQ
jgi:hypothetical protein